MSVSITEIQLDEVNTISIPTDAILLFSLLTVFGLLGYFFHNFLDNQTNQFIEKVDDHPNLELIKEELENNIILESAKVNHKQLEKPTIKKLNFLSPSKLWTISRLAMVAIAGSSLLGIQAIHNSYKGMKTSYVKIKTENKYPKSLLSMAKIKSSNQSQNKVKKINYFKPLLSTNNSSKKNNFSLIKERQTEDFFSF